LRDEPMPADCLIYGAFAYENHRETYDWIDMDGPQKDLALCYKVNQRPPTYCELDERVSLSSLPPKNYYIFWSYWDLAETKMKQFLKDAARRHAPPLELIVDDSPLYLNVEFSRLTAGNFEDIDGVYADAWVHQTMRFGLYNKEFESIYVGLEVPTIPDVTTGLTVIAKCNDRVFPIALVPGLNALCIPLYLAAENRISFQFSAGMAEPGGQRKLFARLMTIRFE
jgi:hypothetical protein